MNSAMSRLHTIAAIAALASASFLQAQAPAGDSLVVTTEWLAAHIGDPSLVIIEVVTELGKRGASIPGSRELFYRHMTISRDGLSTELPSPDSLKVLFEGLGISTGSRVVVYAPEAPMATRLLMTLDWLGHRRMSYLDGGLKKWTAEGRATSTVAPVIARGSMTIALRTDMIATAEWLSPRVGRPGVSLIDTRTDGEYNGTGNRSGMPSAGHLDGARQLQWESLFEEGNGLLLKDRATLQRMYDERVRAGDMVVTYCWVGYRASATYFAARLLGLNAKFYDGSYQDWQQRKLPTRMGEAP